ncbi:MAG: DNA phosphorothioation-dependent restriction protein DptG [Bacillota bacterium]
MDYHLNLDVIKEKFKFDSSLRHNPKMEIEILPYNTKFKDNQYNFREVVGEFIRLVGHKKLPAVVNTDDLINSVLNKIDFENVNQRSEFKQMIKTLFLDDHNQLYLFHPQTLYYINTGESENKKLALFLYNVLWNQENAWTVDDSQEENSHDLMSELLFKSLPQLGSSSEKHRNYAVMLPEISDLFIQDFKWLATKSDLFTIQVEKIISYYYFFYVTQLALRNEAMFGQLERKIKPVYFTFEGEEKLSKTRVSYEYGWRSLEKSISRTFSHVNFLKMLNLSNDRLNELHSYQEIANRVRAMTAEEQSLLEQSFDTLIDEYKNKLSGDSRWELMGRVSTPYDVPVLNKMYLFLNMIDHQFNQTSRSKPYNEYKQWFVHFCQKTFLKSRGRSGKMLILDTDYLLFLTKMIIKDESKIRLKKLFEEFEIRGIVYDRDTQSSIIDYFEKLNLLEKKSDSGDAIYVKAFL